MLTTGQKKTQSFSLLYLSETTLVLCLFLLALAPRLLAPGDFWTADEAKHWSVRVGIFLPAVEEGNYAATNLVGHPGVTTMWLGSLGVLMQRGFASLGLLPLDDPALTRTFLRVPVMLVTSLVVALAYPLLRRLFNQRVALITALLWAGDPFLVAHSKLLHVDALLTSFLLLSILAALVAFRLDDVVQSGLLIASSDRPAQEPAAPTEPQQYPVRWGMLAVSAASAGLALLTKSPSLILIPMTGLIALVAALMLHPQPYKKQLFPLILGISRPLLVWGCITAAVWVALWPAAWVDPVGSAGTVISEIFRNGAEPHGWGNFFLGQPVNDPGLLFYPVALDLRLTPWATVGLVAAGVAAVWGIPRERKQGALRLSNPALALLLLFALLFIGIMSVLAKKFDRYALPAFPVIDLVAGLGLLWLFDAAGALVGRVSSAVRWVATTALWGALLAAMALTLAWYHPYELAYFNPLLGGGPVAEQAIFVGWGEGLEEAGHYITQQDNGCDLGIASWYELVLQPYVCSPVLHQGYITVPGHVHYAVLYINQVQRQIRMEEISPFLRERGSLVATVRKYGIDYAWVYQLRQPRQHELTGAGQQVFFGSSIQLTGYDMDTSEIASTGVLTLTLQWHVLETMNRDDMLFVHVFDEQGRQVGQLDVPPGGLLPTSTWGRNRFIDWVHRVPVERGAAGQRLWVTMGIYDPTTFARLPLRAPSAPAGAPDDGADALVLVGGDSEMRKSSP